MNSQYMRGPQPKEPQRSLKPPTVDGAGNSRKILNSWKEIANYIGRGVRTIQRYEAQLGFPVRRPAGKDRSAVMAFSDEIDEWLNRAPVKNRRHVRPVLLILDRPSGTSISNRKLVLEVGKFNVLTVLSSEELFETAEKFDVDAYVVDCPPGDTMASEICESLKERHPRRPIFAVVAESNGDGQAPKCADYIVVGSDAEKLLAAVTGVFGPARLD